MSFISVPSTGGGGVATYTQTGVGAVTRNVEDRIREDHANITEFGASTAGSAASNAAAIQAALNTGKPVFIPPGAFDFNTQIYPTVRGQVIFGAGRFVSRLNFTGAGFAFAFNDVSDCQVENF